MTESNKIPLAGSERAPLSGASLVGPTDPNQLVEVSVVLKQRRELKLEHLQGRTLSHEEFASTYGADPEHIARIHAFASAHNLTVVDSRHEIARRTIKLYGKVTDLEQAFGVTLNEYEHPGGKYRGRTGHIHLPVELSDIVQGVFGLDNRPQAKPHYRSRPLGGASDAAPANISYNPPQVAQLYNFPTGVTGAGQTIGIIELGGGFQQSDITNYFQSLGITPPTVTSVSVDGGTNSPTNPNSADGEVLLDIEVAGSVAPGANIVVYFAPNTDQGFQDAMSLAIHDSTNNPSAVSISWGGPESTWTTQSMQSMDQVAQEAAALGVTITVASGDNGSSDGVSDGSNNVDFPASSPNVLACGGTTLIASNTTPPTISSETVWNDGGNGGATGGGFSVQFSQPSYQSSLATSFPGQTGRGVPDVSGDADPDTGYNILVDGQQEVVGGTSAVAPLWAGLIALLNQQLNTRLGFINPLIYTLPEPNNGFNDITQGNNGAYSAGPGWDPCTGLGSPIGTTLATLLASPPAS
ncbi:S53 family peptidase [Acidicapsa acidisoli]|uniref:S53 family peptidase n=1 Tax=Acidicapsa acidisoli TaxID=1615681 RepID=UPI0021DFAA8D|nr:S53 family peptidase [Acidicapsa acidisoli]